MVTIITVNFPVPLSFITLVRGHAKFISVENEEFQFKFTMQNMTSQEKSQFRQILLDKMIEFNDQASVQIITTKATAAKITPKKEEAEPIKITAKATSSKTISKRKKSKR
jgi:hypothetical protein